MQPKFDNFFHESTLIPTNQHAYFVSNIKVHWAQKSFLEDDIEHLNFRAKVKIIFSIFCVSFILWKAYRMFSSRKLVVYVI